MTTAGELSAAGVIAAARGALRIVHPRVRRHFFWRLAPTIVLAILEAVGVALVLPFVQSLASETSTAQSFPIRLAGDGGDVPLWIGVAALSALFLRSLASAGLTAWQLRTIAWSESELTRRLVHIYLVQPWTFHQRRDLAELTRNVRLNVWQVHAQMLTPVFTLPGELAVVVSVVVVLVVVSPLAAAAAGLLFGVVALGAGVVGGRRAAQAGVDAQDAALELQRRAHDGLRAAKSLGVHGGGEVLAARLDESLRVSERARYHTSLGQYLPRYFLEATLAVGVGGLALLITALSEGDPLPTVALFATGGVRMIGPLSRLLSANTSLRAGVRAIEPIQRDLALPHPSFAAARRRGAPGHAPRVELRNVSYTYPVAGRPAIEHVDLDIEAGELVALTGPSGSGKTTLVDLVLGLLPPTTGEVLVDGIPLGDDGLAAWMARLGYVPQDALVLDDTVARNVALAVADEDIERHAVVNALRDAELLEAVNATAGGLDQILGDRDGRLSGGERQRLAIARALYRSPDMLVLDEPTSSLDSDNEALLLNTIRALRGQRTVLIVTHRASTAARCDRTIRLENGRVVSNGRVPDSQFLGSPP